MNDGRLRAHLAELELTAAILIYVKTLDEPEAESDGDLTPILLPPRVSNVIAFRRPPPPKQKK